MSDSLIGRTLGRYQIVEKLGQGGMGMVFKAYQASLNRTVAIKVLPAQLAMDPEFVERFRQEAKVIASLQHDSIVHVYDIDQAEHHGGTLYFIVMELVDGQTLRQLVGRRQPMAPERVLSVGRVVGQALEYAHQRGIVHRDIKSANVMVTRDGKVMLMDFGIAKAALGGSGVKTMTGSVLGTPEYMAPEQAQTGRVTAKSDIYSLGVLLYELSTGQLPFTGGDPFSIALKHLSLEPTRPREIDPGLPDWLERIILRAMAKDPTQRYQTAAELVADFDQVAALDSAPTLRSPLTPASGISAAHPAAFVTPPPLPPMLTPPPPPMMTPPPMTPPPITPGAWTPGGMTPAPPPSGVMPTGPPSMGFGPLTPAQADPRTAAAHRSNRGLTIVLLVVALIGGLVGGALWMRPKKVELGASGSDATTVLQPGAIDSSAQKASRPGLSEAKSAPPTPVDARPTAEPVEPPPTEPSTEIAKPEAARPPIKPMRPPATVEPAVERTPAPVAEPAPPPAPVGPSPSDLFAEAERHFLAERFHSAGKSLDQLFTLDPGHGRGLELKQKVDKKIKSVESDLREEVTDLLDELIDAVPERELDELEPLWGGSLDPTTEKYFADIFAEDNRIKASYQIESITVWDRQVQFVATVRFATKDQGHQLRWQGQLVKDGNGPRFTSPMR